MIFTLAFRLPVIESDAIGSFNEQIHATGAGAPYSADTGKPGQA